MDRLPPLPRNQRLHPGFSAGPGILTPLKTLHLDPVRLARLDDYAALLREWNRRVNLVSRRDVERVRSYHIPDSLAAERFLPRDCRAADIGSGGGLPGIPLAIARPDCRMYLVESVGKKAEFLAAALDRLRLVNTRVIHSRAEEIPPLACDVVLSRLTGPLRTTLPRLAVHCHPDGSIVLFKNPTAAEPLPAGLLRRLALAVADTVDLRLAPGGIPRRFILLRPR